MQIENQNSYFYKYAFNNKLSAYIIELSFFLIVDISIVDN